MSDVFFKVAAMVLIGAVLVTMLKTDRAEIGFLLTVATTIVAISLIIKQLYPSAKSLINIYENTISDNSVLSVVVKALIISYVAEFCGNTCRDFGLSALGEKAEFAGKCAVFALSIPLIESILKTAVELVKV